MGHLQDVSKEYITQAGTQPPELDLSATDHCRRYEDTAMGSSMIMATVATTLYIKHCLLLLSLNIYTPSFSPPEIESLPAWIAEEDCEQGGRCEHCKIQCSGKQIVIENGDSELLI